MSLDTFNLLIGLGDVAGTVIIAYLFISQLKLILKTVIDAFREIRESDLERLRLILDNKNGIVCRKCKECGDSKNYEN